MYYAVFICLQFELVKTINEPAINDQNKAIILREYLYVLLIILVALIWSTEIVNKISHCRYSCYAYKDENYYEMTRYIYLSKA